MSHKEVYKQAYIVFEDLTKGYQSQHIFLVGAFLKRAVHSHGFRQCFLNFVFDTHEVTKIVLLKVLQNFVPVYQKTPNSTQDAKLYLLAQGTEPKRFLA